MELSEQMGAIGEALRERLFAVCLWAADRDGRMVLSLGSPDDADGRIVAGDLSAAQEAAFRSAGVVKESWERVQVYMTSPDGVHLFCCAVGLGARLSPSQEADLVATSRAMSRLFHDYVGRTRATAKRSR